MANMQDIRLGSRASELAELCIMCLVTGLALVAVAGCSGLPADDEVLVEGVEDQAQAGEEQAEEEEPVPPENQEPLADAGKDQAVAGGSLVQLDGSGSSDPDADPLSFSWQQTDGPIVALIGANSALPGFSAPNEDATLTFELTVSDGRGGSDRDEVSVQVARSVTPQLYIANLFGDSVTSYRNPEGVNGNIPPDTNLQGAQTKLSNPSDMIVTAEGRLIVSNFGVDDALTSYDDAANTNGNLEPDGNVQGAATQLATPLSLAVNGSEDLAFVANILTDTITVYSDVSRSAFNGNRAPIRTIASAALNAPFGLNFGADDELYVANNGDDNVLVFAGASNLNGVVSPARVITSAEFDNIFDVYIDGADTMYVVDAIDNEVYIFNEASSLNGEQTPDFTLTVSGASALTAIAVDSNDVGYLVDNIGNAILSYDDISTLNGAFLPDRTISGDQTLLSSPIRVFLVE